ncbi:Ig-like domain-containing protein [Kitasatospora sp. GP82]|uniref:L,D-transpeptidase n=1 Tax=Kitasatospora sp. GP82 TaxID=3035089 RepID=UPI0024754550|nr:Ig-like domain-containing protein [Kitasatospora sp. GP82]MDH6128036.1 hypothetical protein [Kitasatospora sp. GP82]
MEPVQAVDAAIDTTRTAAGRSRARRAGRRAGVALVMGGVLLLGAACSSGGSATSSAKGDAAGGGADATPAPKTSAAVLTVSAKDGATDVTPAGFQVTVASGTLTNVEMTDKNGKAVPGQIASDGLSWKPGAALGVGTVYTVNAQAKDSAGLVAASTSSFTTLSPAKTVSTNDNISDNGTYGVGMIISVNFSKPVKNKDEVVKNIAFETNNGTVVKGHWFGGQRLDFRPEKYWKPGTKVTVKYRLKNVEVAPGVYGDVDRDEPFTIGRSQISTADAATHQMTVQKDGATVKTVPITAGNDDNPSWNGTMVISSREKVTRMNSATVSNVKGSEYDISDVPHAMRLTNSGTYVHGNYWGSSFGKSNASHGCISMQDAKGGEDASVAGKFFADSLIGDVVKVVNSKGKTVQPDNGLSGWNLSWASW